MSADRSRIVEIKCGEATFAKACDGEIPANYRAQMQHQLLVTGLATIDYWCYDPDDDGVLMTVKRDDDYIAKLQSRLTQVKTRLTELGALT